jgi:hypothetical protein
VIRERLFSFALVLAIGFLLQVALMVNAAIAAVGAFSAPFLPIPEVFLHLGSQPNSSPSVSTASSRAPSNSSTSGTILISRGGGLGRGESYL